MKRYLLSAILIVLVSSLSLAQTVIRGKVSSADTGEAIIGATVMIKGKLTGTVTNGDGGFELSTSTPLPLILEISYMGYQKVSHEIHNADLVSIQLPMATELLNEVVFSASRIEETIFQSPVTIDKMDMK